MTACILQNVDKGVAFVIPYGRDPTLIGATDLPFNGDPAGVAIPDDETLSLREAANRFLAKPILPGGA